MSLITLDVKNEIDYKNRMIVLDLVEKYFHLEQESLDKFKRLLFNPIIDEMFVPFINDSFRIEKVLEDKNSNEKYDVAWKLFNIYFVNFINKFTITYEDFINNTIYVAGNKRKLFKFIYEYFSSFEEDIKEKIEDLSKYIYNSETIATVYKLKSENDIKTVLRNMLEKTGADKIPLKASKAVMSFNFVDWFLCSTSENWSSCLSLDSTFSSSYWAGLPGLIGDFNRGLFYITDCDAKEYLGIKIERFISRSWTILNDLDKINIVKFYPIKIDECLLDKFNFKYDDLRKSKYPVNLLYDEQGNSLYIFQDTTYFNNDKYLVSGGKGWKGFHKSGKPTYFNFIECGKSLKTIISTESKLSKYLIKNTCSKCSVILEKAPKIINSTSFCEECFRKEKNNFCSSCGDKLSDNEIGNFNLNGHNYCEECYEERVRICSCCGASLDEDHAYYVDEECYCEECYHEHFTDCERCGQTCSNDEVHETPNGSWYCTSCYDEKVGECDICNKKFYYLDLIEDGLDEDYVCNDCFYEKYYRCENCDIVNLIEHKCDCEE